jgi:hypothetical protein
MSERFMAWLNRPRRIRLDTGMQHVFVIVGSLVMQHGVSQLYQVRETTREYTK